MCCSLLHDVQSTVVERTDADGFLWLWLGRSVGPWLAVDGEHAALLPVACRRHGTIVGTTRLSLTVAVTSTRFQPMDLFHQLIGAIRKHRAHSRKEAVDPGTSESAVPVPAVVPPVAPMSRDQLLALAPMHVSTSQSTAVSACVTVDGRLYTWGTHCVPLSALGVSHFDRACACACAGVSLCSCLGARPFLGAWLTSSSCAALCPCGTAAFCRRGLTKPYEWHDQARGDAGCRAWL
jgi:hypothetical protein